MVVGDECLVIIRSNQVKFANAEFGLEGAIPCEIQAKEYKGAVTDYVVNVGNETLTVTVNDEIGMDQQGYPERHQVFLKFAEDSVTIIPKKK